MLRHCVTFAVLGCVLAAPKAQHQYQPQQTGGVPPHLLRQYLADQQQGAPVQEQTQVITRTAHPAPAPRPAQQLYSVQSEAQYQQPQYQAQPQPQYQSQAQSQPQYQAQAQPLYQPQRQQYQPQRPATETREPEEYDANPSYQFGFDVNDDQFTNYQNRKEQRDGDVIKGSYSVVDSDGFIRTVTYTADPKEGFKAEVSRQPTDIVVKIPTPKPQLQQHIAPHAQPHPQAHAQPHSPPRPQPTPQQYYRYEQ